MISERIRTALSHKAVHLGCYVLRRNSASLYKASGTILLSCLRLNINQRIIIICTYTRPSTTTITVVLEPTNEHFATRPRSCEERIKYRQYSPNMSAEEMILECHKPYCGGVGAHCGVTKKYVVAAKAQT